MQKKPNILCIIILLSFLSISFMGCTDEKKDDSGVEYESLSEMESKHGFVENPEWSGAQTTEITFPFEVNGSIVIGIKAVLVWVDDHNGGDSSDIYDVLELTISAGGGSVSKQDGTGRIELSLGEDDVEENNTEEEKAEVTEEPKGLGDSFAITVTCIECGTYNQAPFIGPFLRYYDTGNDFKVDIEYDYLQPILL